MRRIVKYVSVLFALLLTFGILLHSFQTDRPIHRWLAAGKMQIARSGACSAALSDGRVLITGGEGSYGILNSAEVFDASGSFTTAASMFSGRADHVCVVLESGRVLVAGGRVSGGGATNAAEIYDPVADTWSPAGAMARGRAGATASLLKNGDVLIAGGEDNGAALASLEMFEAANSVFRSVPGSLSSPRKNHAAAILSDGRVLIAGGSNGAAALDSADIFDLNNGSVSQAGKLLIPRSGLSATTLLDGKVLLAGGTGETGDIAVAELYDPQKQTFTATASMQTGRHGHQAFRLPDNNNVLIVGGTSSGQPSSAAELYIPWQGSFTTIGALSSPRAGATGTALPQGKVLIAGGTSSKAALASSEAIASATVTVNHGRTDFSPGMIVFISGTGWQPGETVKLTLTETNGPDPDVIYQAIADNFGNISNSEFAPDEHDVNVNFLLTARGLSSKQVAQTTFADSSANLDQCGNGNGGGQPCVNNATYSNWLNGNLGPSKSLYFEGDSIPYRMVMTGLSVGAHTLVIQWDTTKAGTHALDYLTSWDRNVVAGSSLCSDLVGGCAALGAPDISHSIPVDSNLAANCFGNFGKNCPPAAPIAPVAGVFTLYGGSITSFSCPSGLGTCSGPYSLSAPYTGDSSTAIAINFTATGPTAVLGWGGHIATRKDWGLTTSAVAITGSPYHTRLKSLDGSGGNQDRSLSADAVIFPGSITIIKAATPTTAGVTFPFTASPAPLTNFSLDASNSAPGNAQQFTSIISFPSTGYIVTETPPTAWAFDSIKCVATSSNGGSTSINGSSVTIKMNEGEDWTCTFANHVKTHTVTLIKHLSPTTDSGRFDLTAAGVTVTNQGHNGQAQNTSVPVESSVTVSEAATAGTNLDYYTSVLSCSGVSASGTTSASFTMPDNDVTCTVTNTLKTYKVTLTKALSPTTDPGKFNLTAAGVTTTNNGNGGSAQATSVGVGSSVSVSEAVTPSTNTDANNYTSSLSCDNGASGATSASFTMPNADVNCTVTNTRKTHKLTLTKALVPSNDPGVFNLTAAGVTASNQGNGGSVQDTSAAVGSSVSVSEAQGAGTVLSNYTSSLTCDNGSSGTTSASFTMPDADVNCTVTNTRKTHKVTLTKVLLPSNDPGVFNLTAAGVTVSNQGDGGSVQNTSVAVGATGISVSEAQGTGTVLSNYTSSLTCDNGSSGATSASFTMPDADVNCTVTNTRKTHKVTLTKALVPSNDPGLFNLTAAGVTVSNQGDGGSAQNTSVAVGTTGVSVSEAQGTGTVLTNYTSSLTCDNGATGTTSASFTMPDADVNCTITNTRKTRKLTLTKVLVPSSDPGVFNLTAAGVTTSNQGNGGTAQASVPAGSTGVSVSETQGAGTVLANYNSSLTCDNGATGTTSASFTMPDADVNCTVTNTRKTHKVTLTKSLSPSNDSGRFDLTAAGVTATSQGNGGSAQNASVAVGTTDVTVSEIAASGSNLAYYTTNLTCSTAFTGGGGAGATSGSFTMPDADVTCTITNTRKTHSVRLTKSLSPSTDSGRFNLTAAGVTANGQGDGGFAQNASVAVGATGVTVSETAASGSNLNYYTTNLTCSTSFTAGGGAGATSGSFTMPDADVTCTITNTRKTHSVTLIKSLLPSTDSGRFDLTAAGVTATSQGDGGLAQNASVAVGTTGVSVSEIAASGSNLANYTTNLTCSTAFSSGGGQGATSGSFTMPDADVTCTITNTKGGQIKIVKQTNGGDGAFGFTAKGPNGFSQTPSITTSGGNGTTTPTYAVAAGSGYSVIETTIPAGWSTTPGISCVDQNNASLTNTSFTVAPGGTVTCTFTNSKLGTIKIVKKTIGGDGTFGFTATGPNGFSQTPSITTSGGNGTTTPTYTVAPASGYSVTETTIPTGWSTTPAISCVDQNNVAVTNTSFAVAIGGTVTCTFTNTKLAAIILVKKTVGGNGTFAFTDTGGLAVSSFNIQTSSNTGSQTFLYLSPGTSGYSFTETVPAGWAGNTANVSCAVTAFGAGGTTIDTTNATTGVVFNPGTVVSPTINTIGAGATVTCTFTNSTLPTLTVVKNVRSSLTSVIFYFGLDGTDQANYFPPSGVTVSAPNGIGQGSYGPAVISVGPHSLTEIITPPSTQGFVLTDISCSGGSNVSIDLANGSASFTANYGDKVTCTFDNSNVGITRTQGFWATHTSLANAVWNGLPLPIKSSIPAFPPVIGTPDAYLCGVLITAVPQNEDNWLMGGFYAKPSQTSKGGKRSNIDHDRILMLQQYLAAVLNNHLFGSFGASQLAGFRADYCSGNDSAIQKDTGRLDLLNNLGDNGAFTPGASGTPQASQAQADIDVWDTPLTPGIADEDSITRLALVKNVSGGAAVATDFTLTATCTTSADGMTGPCSGFTQSGAGGFGATTVKEGTYSLTDPAVLGYTPGTWSCTNTGAPGRYYLLNTGPGTASLSIEQGAQLSCTITNSQ